MIWRCFKAVVLSRDFWMLIIGAAIGRYLGHLFVAWGAY